MRKLVFTIVSLVVFPLIAAAAPPQLNTLDPLDAKSLELENLKFNIAKREYEQALAEYKHFVDELATKYKFDPMKDEVDAKTRKIKRAPAAPSPPVSVDKKSVEGKK